MNLRDRVFGLCRRLAHKGWGGLLRAHGLDIRQNGAAALERVLLAPLKSIERKLSGFEDFSRAGRRAIEPGSPARSLLFHALASPAVLQFNGKPLDYFPTLADLELVENYIFALQRGSIEDLIAQARKRHARLAIVVFAQEYRPAQQTCHRLHADLVYSRTGVARVGTAEAVYRGDLRGFVPLVENDPFALAVLPSRFAAWLAMLLPGNAAKSLPMRFRGRKDAQSPAVRKPDSRREFWVPVHKLFSGDECLMGLDLNVTLSCRHFNEKIRRVHLQLNGADHRFPPFLFCDRIAEFSSDCELGQGVLMPVVHPRLVEPAQIKNESGQGAWVTYTVTDVDDRYGSVPLNEELRPHGVMFRNAPQYVNAKTEVLDSNELVDLNRDVRYETLADRLRQGPYRALHYVDFTGDGWVQVRCPELDGKLESSEAQAAYSLVTAPDFFPSCDQAVLSEWTSKVHPPRKMRGTIWKERPPDALCDQRYPANLQLPVAPPYKNPFHLRDDSITAVVSHVGSPTVKSGERVESKELARHNHLPDDAAGVFDPGWDVSLDHLPDDERAAHLAAYGLGSPFPEDAKLCAALSAYWPAVSPDTTRLMWPMAEDKLHTTCPLTDEEIGQSGLLPWDGVAGPRVVHVDGQQFAEFADFQHVDYVQNALAGKFSLRLTAAVDSTEYEWRVLAMAAVHTTITPASSRWSDWIVLSFRPVRVGDVVHPRPTILTCDVEEFENMRQAVETSQSLAWGAPLYRFEMITQRSGKKA